MMGRNKPKSNQLGFGAVEGIIFAVVVIKLGAVGYMVYKNNHKTVTPTTTNSTATQIPTIQTQTIITLTIKELGVQVTLTEDIKDANYRIVKNAELGDVAYISTDSLDKLNPKCIDGYTSPRYIGNNPSQGIARNLGNDIVSAVVSTDNHQGVTYAEESEKQPDAFKKIGNYYYGTATGGFICSPEHEVHLIASTYAAFKTIRAKVE